jgi:hypothetical protein
MTLSMNIRRRYADFHMLSVAFSYCNAECHYAECRYHKYRYVECRGAFLHCGKIYGSLGFGA